jgi:hypothetical protein
VGSAEGAAVRTGRDRRQCASRRRRRDGPAVERAARLKEATAVIDGMAGFAAWFPQALVGTLVLAAGFLKL